jgi:hypothetical protein
MLGMQPLSPGEMWLDGEVLACSCPQCQAPMSVRLWLMVADCWRCGTSIELTAEQEQMALRLLRERQEARRTRTAPLEVAEPQTLVRRSDQVWADPVKPTVRQTVQPLQTAPQPPVAPPVEPPPPAVIAPPVPETVVAPPPVDVAPAPPPMVSVPTVFVPPVAPLVTVPVAHAPPPGKVIAALRPTHERPRQGLNELLLSCCLTSIVLHMVLIILLGLWIISGKQPRELILAMEVNSLDTPGDAELETIKEGVEFDDPGVLNSTDMSEGSPFTNAESETLKSLPIIGTPASDLPGPMEKPFSPPGPANPGAILAGRDPMARSQLVRSQGGTIASEAAVARGLEWLARHQNADGSWSLEGFNHAGNCNGECRHPGGHSDTSATALALLPFLGAGQTHLRGNHTVTVARGLRWLIDAQKSDGDLRGRGIGRMYAHGQAAIALCEAYALTQDKLLRDPAQRAIGFIVSAQHPEGGWRYGPGDPGDTSVVGWQLMALRSAKMAYLNVPDKCFDRAMYFLDSVQVGAKKGRGQGQFSYMPGSAPTHVMTAEGLLCRQYGGWKRDFKPLVEGVDYLLERYPPSRNNLDMYYIYYATQVMHHMGGNPWEQWNSKLRDILVETQATRGHEAGSWAPQGHHDHQGGRVYMTALSLCTLEVYYRHLPLYQDNALDSDKAKSAKK